jgi:hypothetical protein
MMGEVSNAKRTTTVLRRRKRPRAPVAALVARAAGPAVTRLRARGRVPASGQIVFRSSRQILW